MGKRGRDKCDYDTLSADEIKSLKNARIEPHDLKPKKHGSHFDLFKCKPSGEVTVSEKTKDLDGKRRLNKNRQYEKTGINIYDLPKVPSHSSAKSEAYVEFRLMGFHALPTEIAKSLKEVGVNAQETWRQGTRRMHGSKLLHLENGVAIRADRRKKSWQNRIDDVLEKLRPHAQQLRETCHPYYAELSCVLYVVGDDRPEISLTKDQIAALSDLGAEFDLDLYFH